MKNEKLNQTGKTKEEEFLISHVYYGLTNLNDGFDLESIYYFSEADFAIVLDRVEALGIGISGIEPWLDGQDYDVATCEEFEASPYDSSWYRKAFELFKELGGELMYAAGYEVPEGIEN